MNIRKFALIAGIIMLAMGVLSLIPQLSQGTSDLPPLKITTSYGLFLGLFPLNIFNKIALIFFGAGGIMAYTNKKDSIYASHCYARWVFWTMAPLAILGIFPLTSTLFGYWPLFGMEVLAHGIFAVLAGLFTFAKAPVPHAPY